MAKKFITTPIYYVNDEPHIGHAYSTIAADVLARHFKQKGEDVYFLTGTDEHGAKIAKAALGDSAEIDETKIQVFADRISDSFKQAWDDLKIEYDQFIRTTDPKHKAVVSDLLTKIKTNGYIYQGIYEGLYCVGCEEYKKETDLEDGNCPVHKKPVENLKEDVWFFELSAFQAKVKALIESNEIYIYPETRRNEVLSFLDSGLEDIAISRSRVGWGIKLPWDETQTIYVWVDALLNYYSGTIIAERPDLFPPDIQILGKDILRFHAVIWPALLLAADLSCPKQLAITGFFTKNGHKMSKSLGNTIRSKELIEQFGVDGARYLILSQFPFGSDGDFNTDKLKENYNAHLANELGNLVQRTLVVAQKLNISIEQSEPVAKESIQNKIEEFNFEGALDEIWQIVRDSNVLIDQEKPWTMEPESEKAKEIINQLTINIRTIAWHLQPFMPESSQKIFDQLKSGQPEVLFPRIK